MNRVKWSELLEHKGDALLTWLHELEEGCKKAIHGIWLFIVKKLPELWRELLVFLYETFFYACQVTVRLGRLAALVAAWVAILIGPICIYPGVLTLTWLLLALVGSIWGAQRQIKKNRNQQFTKEASHARA